MNFQYEPLGDEYQFQTFLKDLFNAVYSTDTFEEYGSKGNIQHGIDIYSQLHKIGIQVKKKDINRNKKAVVNELRNEITSTMEQIKGFEFPIEHLYFATTLKKDIILQNACINASLENSMNVILLSWDDIQDKIPHCPSVRNKYYPHLQEAKSSAIDLSEKIREVEKLIQQYAFKNSTIKKQFRDIPHCEILLPPPIHKLQKEILDYVIKMSLYETFSQTKYKKFGCLIQFSMDYTQFPDGTTGPGLQLISGEVVFLSNCSRIAKEMQYNQAAFFDRLDRYENNSHYSNIQFRLELVPFEGLQAYEFEIDGQTGSYHIKRKNHEDLDYDKLDSLSSVFPFIAKTTLPGFVHIDLDKIENHSGFMKLYHHFLIEDSFKPRLLKVNVEDFDDWDYEYKMQDKME